MNIEEFIEKIINGSGGFKVKEDRELMAYHYGREYAVAEFVIRCLANPGCEGSEDVLNAINEQRNKTKL